MNSISTLMHLIALGRKVAVLPRVLTTPLRDDLTTVPVTDVPPSVLLLAWPAHSTSPSVAALARAAAAATQRVILSLGAHRQPPMLLRLVDEITPTRRPLKALIECAGNLPYDSQPICWRCAAACSSTAAPGQETQHPPRFPTEWLVQKDGYRSTEGFPLRILAAVITLPVLWLYGASGVGKTTVAWELFIRLAREGVSTGYVDIDQLGMCYAPPTPQDWAPEPAADPGRHRLKARTLDAVVANFQAAGARCVLVPGVTEPVRGVEADLVPHAAVTRCRLRAEPADLGRRLAARGRPTDDLAEEFAYAEALDRVFATDTCVDTTGLTVAEVADRVRARTGWPNLAIPVEKPSSTPHSPWRLPEPPPGEILWLSGPAAVGKSSIGWQVYQQVRRRGVTAAFVDLDQIGFHRPAPTADSGTHRLKAANLAAVWHEFQASGAECLIVVGPIERPEDVTVYTTALPASRITLCRLHASRQVLAERVALRGQGLTPTWGLAGDELIGQPPTRLRDIADRAARIIEALDGVGDLRVDTDNRPPEEIAADILRRTAWPPGG